MTSMAPERLLHARPTRSILSQAMDEHEGPVFAESGVADIDVTEPDLHGV
jgi:hypothetical protein